MAPPFPFRVFQTLGLKLTLFFPPFNLRAIYIHDAPSWTNGTVVAGIVGVAALSISVTIRQLRTSRAFPLLLLFGAALAPGANIIPMTHDVGDSHLYLPLFALSGFLALALERATVRLTRFIRLVARLGNRRAFLKAMRLAAESSGDADKARTL